MVLPKSKSGIVPKASLSLPVCKKESKSKFSSAPLSSPKLRPRSKPLGYCRVSRLVGVVMMKDTYVIVNVAKWWAAIVHGLVGRWLRLHGLLLLAVLPLVKGLLVDWRDWGHGSG